ncbi:MAG TPA: hypothetical protein VIJ04_24310 [Xanthobacteraceae bacterium]
MKNPLAVVLPSPTHFRKPHTMLGPQSDCLIRADFLLARRAKESGGAKTAIESNGNSAPMIRLDSARAGRRSAGLSLT